MGVSSLLFRQESDETKRPSRAKSLRQMLKPWPQATPSRPAPPPMPTEEEDAAWLSGEIASTVVHERLAKFTNR